MSYLFRTIALSIMVAAAASMGAAQYKGAAATKDGLVKALRSHQFQTREFVNLIQNNGVDFQVTPEIERELVSAGARPQMIAAARANYRAPAVAATKTAATRTTTTGPQLSRPTGEPMGKTEIISLLANGVADERVRSNVEARGVNFKASPGDKQDIRSAGGSVALANLVEQSYLDLNTSTTSSSSSQQASTVSYDDLINLAIQYIASAKYAEAGQALDKAVALDPTQPRAYQIVGFALLYGGGDITLAEQFMRKAIELGGSATFRVIHDDDGTFTKFCTGSLFVAKDTVRYESDDNGHTFETANDDIKSAKMQGGFRQLFNNRVGAFNIKLKSGDKDSKNYNFAPGSGAEVESRLILRLIGKS